ncbi:MAG TPA: MBL fold metallo-hydrolase [Pseudobdellovibrionaceae bacterium]|nr:MBL fold metallo-hydrolase [Pseudobdellovibrionaceae bacterium]
MKKITFILLLLSSLSCLSIPQSYLSDHFDGKKYFNPNRPHPIGFTDFLKWQMTRQKASWPDFINDVVQIQSIPKSENRINIIFVNHATVLIQIGELNILTDPIWSDRASPFSFLGPKRVRKPGIEIEKLPPIHVILISHNHYDHLDLPTLQILSQKFNPLILVPLGNQSWLKGEGIISNELDWGQSQIVGEYKITFEKAYHWSARGMFDRFESLWGSFVVEGKGKKIYFAGDTGYGDHFKELAKKYSFFDLSLIPIGAYEPRWFMKGHHLNPEDAILAHQDLNSKRSLGIHYGTFQLADEGVNQPLEDLKMAREKYKIKEEDFVAAKNGEIFKVQ